MNALDMLGGFTVAANPLGGTDASGSAADGSSAPGAFEAFVAQALQVPLGDAAPAQKEADDDEAADAFAANLSMLLAMSGATLMGFTPQVNPAVTPSSPSAPAQSSDVAVDGAGAVATGGPVVVTMGDDTLPCTLHPAGDGATEPGAFEQASVAAVATGTDASTIEVQSAPVSAAAKSTDKIDTVQLGTSNAPILSTSTAEPGTEKILTGANQAPRSKNAESVLEKSDITHARRARSDTPTVATVATTQAADLSEVATLPSLPSHGGGGTTPNDAIVAPRSVQTDQAETSIDRRTIVRADAARGKAAAALQAALERARTGEPGPVSVAAPAATAAPASTGIETSDARPAEQGRMTNTGPTAKPTTAASAVAPERFVTPAREVPGESSDTGTKSGSDGRGRTPLAIVTPQGTRVESTSTTFVMPSGVIDAASVAVRETAQAVTTETAFAVPTAQEDAHNVQTLVRSVRMHFNDGGGEARLQLDPEHLGPVTLTVKVEQGRVSAHVQTETADAGRWIESHQQELRNSLREQGLDVKDFVVSTNPDGRRERERPQDAVKPRERQRRADASTPTFEVLV